MTKPISASGPSKIIAGISAAGGRALIAFVGVQSNQFPRAADLARLSSRRGLPVAVGGFHVSGCLAMLPELPAEIAAAAGARRLDLRRGGEELRLDEVLRDAYAGG